MNRLIPRLDRGREAGSFGAKFVVKCAFQERDEAYPTSRTNDRPFRTNSAARLSRQELDCGLRGIKVSDSLPNAQRKLTGANECSTANHRSIQPGQDLNLAQPDTWLVYTIVSFFIIHARLPISRTSGCSTDEAIHSLSPAVACIGRNDVALS